MSVPFLTLDDIRIDNKRILIREDFNVPIVDNDVQNDLRIRAALPGILHALNANCQVLLMSHLGRPVEGFWQAEFSLQPVAVCLEKLLNIPVKFVKNWFGAEILASDKLVLLENVRFLVGETENSPDLAAKMASLCDVFVMDAFGSAHRAHASTVGVADCASVAVAGPLLVNEVLALDKVMSKPRRPVVAVIGGAKISTKLAVLENLITKVDILIIGGGMANTLLAAEGYNVGASLTERELVDMAKRFLITAANTNCQVILPVDIVTQNFVTKDLLSIGSSDKIFDIGPKTIEKYTRQIECAATVLWNGPLGIFEDPAFANGTKSIAKAIAKSDSFSVVGGGDTVSAIEQLGLLNSFSYISTGGGAFLEYIDGTELPAIKALINKRNNAVETN